SEDLLSKSAAMSATATAAAAAADPQARAAIAGEARPAHACAVCAAIMLGDDLYILVPFLAISVPILDPHVREVHLLIEVGETMLACPLADFFIAPIGVPVVVGAVAIALVEPRLVLALELVIEDDAVDGRAPIRQALRRAFVRPIDLNVVGELALAF